MSLCPKCGHRDHPYWRTSRFEINAFCCTKAEFEEIEPELSDVLGDEPLVDGDFVYYRRGSAKAMVYRVPKWDYKVDRERKNHYKKAQQS